jgi:hypothetical protein
MWEKVWLPVSRAGRTGAHALGQATQTGLRHRHRTLPELRRALKIIAAIEDPPVIVKILSHLGLPTCVSTLPSATGSPAKL